jgi:hypothetical protein
MNWPLRLEFFIGFVAIFSVFRSASGSEGMLTPQFAVSFRESPAGMETSLTRAITIIALTCFLVVGAAATSILSRDSVPMPRSAAEDSAPLHPVSNKEGKKDRLAVVAYALAAYEQPPQTPAQAQLQAQAQAAIPDLGASLRQAYASAEPADVGLPKLNEPAKLTEPANPPASEQPSAVASPKPKAAAAKPASQKNYALLSDAQIAGIKERLKLTSSQEYYWPAVETALRAVARKIHQKRQVDPNATGLPIDPDSDEVQQLKSAAMPLLFQLREDQKNEVRSLARVIGLERVAAMI